jgi:hypothetical protein
MASDDESDRLESLFARYVDRLNDGEKLDPEAVLAEEPVHGPKILEHLGGPGSSTAGIASTGKSPRRSAARSSTRFPG